MQTNSTEAGGDGTKYRSSSVLSYTFSRDQLAGQLKCLVHHPALDTGTTETTGNLDVLCKLWSCEWNVTKIAEKAKEGLFFVESAHSRA